MPTITRGRVPTLYVYVGLPASGKTTDAQARMLATPGGEAVRVNSDDARAMLHARHDPDRVTQAQVIHARNLLITAFLTDGVDVYVDDINMVASQLDTFVHLALETGATFEVLDFTSVPVDDCVERDKHREAPVGEQTIRQMARRARKLKLPEPPEPFAAAPARDPNLPDVVLCDIDGTLAQMGPRDPYDWSRVHEDLPRPAVVKLVRALTATGTKVIAFSGRDSVCRDATQAWLDEHVVPGLDLYMRTAGDNRRDSLVKHEMFHSHIAGVFNVDFVLDDRDQVTRTWRTLGLDCLQVQPGAF